MEKLVFSLLVRTQKRLSCGEYSSRYLALKGNLDWESKLIFSEGRHFRTQDDVG